MLTTVITSTQIGNDDINVCIPICFQFPSSFAPYDFSMSKILYQPVLDS